MPTDIGVLPCFAIPNQKGEAAKPKNQEAIILDRSGRCIFELLEKVNRDGPRVCDPLPQYAFQIGFKAGNPSFYRVWLRLTEPRSNSNNSEMHGGLGEVTDSPIPAMRDPYLGGTTLCGALAFYRRRRSQRE